MSKQLIGFNVLRGLIRCETALRIGGSRETLEIGGLDNPVIKHPLTQMPYIPGSSLKGKMRSLMELKEGKFEPDGSPYQGKIVIGDEKKEDANCLICRVFGPHKNTDHGFGPTRILVRDADLTPEWEEKYRERRNIMGNASLELKQETSIDRRIGIAKGGTLRTNERVPAGTEFAFEIVIRNFDWGFSNEEEENLRVVTEAMRLLEQDYLGGSGSRGYGKISFQNVTLNGEPYDIH